MMNINKLKIEKKSTKMLKRFAALFLVVLISIDSVAAIVGDNDGPSFITKAEFENLKIEFDEQIDRYNKSIDEKIDGAIASYLAGIRIQNYYTLKQAESELEYPITFRMKNGVFNWDHWKTNGATPYWAPDYKTYIWGVRATANFLVNKEFTSSKATNRFYNGKWNSEIGMYLIDGMLNDVSGIITVKTCFYNLPTLQYADEQYVTFGFVLDQSSTYGRVERGTGWNTRDKVRASGNSLIDFFSGSTSYSSLLVDAIWSWNSNAALSISSSSTSNEHYLNQYKSPSNGYTEGNNPGSLTYTSSLKYTPSKINFIMNAYDTNRTDTTGKRIELPVAYETHIYLTNKNNFKKDLQNGSAINTTYWNGYRIGDSAGESGWNAKQTYRTTWRFGNMISPGWTLEPQFSGYSRDIYKRSFMEPHLMYYIVKTPYTDEEKVQVMTNGILLTEADQDIKSLQIKLKLSSETQSVKKYLVLSKQPIEQMNYSNVPTEAAADADRYYKIYTDRELKSTATYTYELSEGENKVYIGDIYKDDLVYYKILWDTSNTSYATITEDPELVAVGY